MGPQLAGMRMRLDVETSSRVRLGVGQPLQDTPSAATATW
jgi:hypothetical protein